MKQGIKHLIECNCILPQYRNVNPPLYHKFVVFSIVEDDNVKQKIAQCNNCGILHKIEDICKSTIMHGSEDGSVIRTIEEISASLPLQLQSILKSNNCDIATYEQVEFNLENEIDEEIILQKKDVGNDVNVKMLMIDFAKQTFKIKNEVFQKMVV